VVVLFSCSQVEISFTQSTYQVVYPHYFFLNLCFDHDPKYLPGCDLDCIVFLTHSLVM
jgi:hypothetical protein